MQILVALLYNGLPAQVDSMCIAGLLDLLRTKGVWFLSVRYGLIYGGLRTAGNLAALAKKGGLWPKAVMTQVADAFEKEWSALVATKNAISQTDDEPITIASLRTEFIAAATPPISALLAEAPGCALPGSSGGSEAAARAFIQASVDAFIDQDLYTAARQLLAKAKGSFGLGLSHSLDASNELVLAARGQTISSIQRWGSNSGLAAVSRLMPHAH